MWVKSYSKVYQDVKKEDIWRAWAHVYNWPKWDKDLEYCQIEEGFAFSKGSHFILKPKGAPKIKITLSEVVTNEKFTDYCKFFGATMHDNHELEDTPAGLRIKSRISVSGPLGFLWVKLVAKNVANSVPDQIDSLVNFVSTSNE